MRARRRTVLLSDEPIDAQHEVGACTPQLLSFQFAFLATHTLPRSVRCESVVRCRTPSWRPADPSPVPWAVVEDAAPACSGWVSPDERFIKAGRHGSDTEALANRRRAAHIRRSRNDPKPEQYGTSDRQGPLVTLCLCWPLGLLVGVWNADVEVEVPPDASVRVACHGDDRFPVVVHDAVNERRVAL